MRKDGVCLMARKSMHTGGTRTLRIRAIGDNAFIAEPEVIDEVFNPEAGKVDDNPFPEEQQTEEQPVEVAPLDYESMTVEELKALLRARGLPVAGTKAELIARLIKPIPPPKRQLKWMKSLLPKKPRQAKRE